MGQRTQVAIIIENKTNNTNTLKVYHDQWGIGRKQYMLLMDLVNKFFLQGTRYDMSKFDDYFGIDNPDNPLEWKKKIDAEMVQKLLTPEGADKFIFSHCDNNNGGLVVHAVVNNWGERDKSFLEFGFLLGSENEYSTFGGTEFNLENKDYGPAFSRWLSAEEYAGLRCNKEYTEKNFMKMFNEFIKYFEVNEIK